MTSEGTTYPVEVRITPREGILDPEGETIQRALGELGYEGVDDVRAGRLVRLRVRGPDADSVGDRVREMCRELIANPVIEDFEVRVHEPEAAGEARGATGR